MKLSRIALAMLVAAPLAAANAGVTITPLMLGYTMFDTQHNNGGNDGDLTDSVELDDDLFVGAALGVELTPWLGFEAEYSQIKGDTSVAGNEYKGENIAGNFYVTSDLFTKNYDSKIKPYALSLRTEARGTYHFDEQFWNYTALAGLNVVLGGHLKPAAPVVEVVPVEPTPIVEPQPQELTEDLNMELRVFFDTNKSNIKDQYKPEIAKVAEKLGEYPNATARIDGHTDNTGPRALNERLSLARANSVKSSLVNEYNIDPSRLTAQGFAWDQPIADNSTKEGRAMNRRVFATITGSRTVVAQPGQAQ